MLTPQPTDFLVGVRLPLRLVHINYGINPFKVGPQFHSTLTGHAFGDCRSMRVDTAQFLF